MRSKLSIKSPVIAVLGSLLCVTLWGTAFPLIKLGYSQFALEQGDLGAKLLFAGLRFTLAGALVFLFGLLKTKKPAIPERRDLPSVLLLGTVMTALQYLLAYVGVGYTTASNTSILTGSASIISVAAAAVFFKNDKFTPQKALGCAVGLAGITVVNLGDFSLDAVNFLGDLLVLMSAVSSAAGNIITKKISKNRDPVTITAWQLLFGGLILTAAGLLWGGRLDLGNAGGVCILLWLAVVSAVSFLLWTALLRVHPVSKITVFTMLVPVFGTLWSWLLLGESVFSAANIISLLLIAAGILLVNIRQ